MCHKQGGFLLVEMCVAMVLLMVLATSCSLLIWFLQQEQIIEQQRRDQVGPWLQVRERTDGT